MLVHRNKRDFFNRASGYLKELKIDYISLTKEIEKNGNGADIGDDNYVSQLRSHEGGSYAY